MGVLDYTYRLKAQAGDTTPHDELAVSGDLSGGTITLQENSGDYAWRFVGVALTSGPSKAVSVSIDGGGVTIAVRLKVVTASATTGAAYVRYRPAATSSGIGYVRNTATALRARYSPSFDAPNHTHGSGFLTYVARISTKAASTQDQVHSWVTGGSGDAADAVSPLNNVTASTLNEILAGVTDGTVEISDFVTWPEELSDAQCRAIATDIRGTLDASGETALSATNIAAGNPTLDTPVITQDNALTSQSISAGIPVLGQPAIPTEGNHDLIATGIGSQPPTLGTPTLTSGILGANIPSEGEHGGSPVPNDFTITPTALYSWEVVTPPSAGTLEVFSDLTFTWDALGVPDGDYSWVYRLYENGVSVGTATVYMHVGALAVERITAGIPTLGTPSLTDVPSGTMVAENIAAAAPVLGTPALVSVAPVGSIIWPSESDVRLGVAYGPTGTEYTGTMAGGGGTYPTAESIAAAVVSALQGTTIPVNIKAVNDKPITGGGVTGDSMRPV